MKEDEHDQKEVAVAVMTPDGIYPGENTLRREPAHTVVSEVLIHAAKHLQLTNTADWVVLVKGERINPQETFKSLGLKCIVDLDWHKPEGGGGA